MSPLENFKEGPFSLRLYEIGAYSEGSARVAAALPPVLEDATRRCRRRRRRRSARSASSSARRSRWSSARRAAAAAPPRCCVACLRARASAGRTAAAERGRRRRARGEARGARRDGGGDRRPPIRDLFFCLFKAIALARKWPCEGDERISVSRLSIRSSTFTPTRACQGLSKGGGAWSRRGTSPRCSDRRAWTGRSAA